MSDDQECTHILKMGVKEWAHSFFFLVSEIWAKLKKLVSVEHVVMISQTIFDDGTMKRASEIKPPLNICENKGLIL